ncbi:MAG: hypothetical protein KF761_10695 [Salinibacterium sp.]|nr:hypothetical protein [Salinibacterium sp.]
MRRTRLWGTAVATFVVLALPFIGGGGPGLITLARADSIPAVPTSSVIRLTTADLASGTVDRRRAAAAAGDSCPSFVPGFPTDAVGDTTSPLGVGGTAQDDLVTFAIAFNEIRVANCLEPIPWRNFTWDSCMEQRLFWMAEDPSTDPASAWGHMGSVRSDGVPSVGCDGNLAGGPANTGATVALKWWNSEKHRISLYRPDANSSGACIGFAMSHGGIPNESPDFTRAAARWYDC